MQFHFNKKQLIRWFYYIIGMLILAMGLTLNAESNLGSSPIISIPYTLSFLWPVSFANLTLALYVLFVMLEFILKGKNRRWTDILQIPLSIVFTRFLDLFTAWFDFTDSSFAGCSGGCNYPDRRRSRSDCGYEPDRQSWRRFRAGCVHADRKRSGYGKKSCGYQLRYCFYAYRLCGRRKAGGRGPRHSHRHDWRGARDCAV